MACFQSQHLSNLRRAVSMQVAEPKDLPFSGRQQRQELVHSLAGSRFPFVCGAALYLQRPGLLQRENLQLMGDVPVIRNRRTRSRIEPATNALQRTPRLDPPQRLQKDDTGYIFRDSYLTNLAQNRAVQV